MYNYYFLFLGLLWILPAQALSTQVAPYPATDTLAPITRELRYDAPPTKIHRLDTNQLKQLARDEAFDYFREKKQAYSLSDKLKHLLGKWFDMLFSQGVNAKVLRYAIYLLLILSIFFILLKLLGIRTSHFLYHSKKHSPISPGIVPEDIQQTDFPEAIRKAVLAQDYRLAVRYLYLYMLKKMDEKSFIHWKESKTNREFELELKNPALKADFEEATVLFDHVCYGEFPLPAARYAQVKTVFEEIDQKLLVL